MNDAVLIKHHIDPSQKLSVVFHLSDDCRFFVLHHFQVIDKCMRMPADNQIDALHFLGKLQIPVVAEVGEGDDFVDLFFSFSSFTVFSAD